MPKPTTFECLEAEADLEASIFEKTRLPESEAEAEAGFQPIPGMYILNIFRFLENSKVFDLIENYY